MFGVGWKIDAVPDECLVQDHYHSDGPIIQFVFAEMCNGDELCNNLGIISRKDDHLSVASRGKEMAAVGKSNPSPYHRPQKYSGNSY
jgi:hypothetical protein